MHTKKIKLIFWKLKKKLTQLYFNAKLYKTTYNCHYGVNRLLTGYIRLLSESNKAGLHNIWSVGSIGPSALLLRLAKPFIKTYYKNLIKVVLKVLCIFVITQLRTLPKPNNALWKAYLKWRFKICLSNMTNLPKKM